MPWNHGDRPAGATAARPTTTGLAQPSAREDLIVRYLPLARRLAARYRGCGEPYEDLVQIASVGLVKAANRFDPDRGVAFGAFAEPTILGELRRYLRDCAWPLHVERPSQQRAQLVLAAQRQISVAALGRQPGVHELAEYLGLSAEAVIEGLLAVAARQTVSIDAPAPGSEADPQPRLERFGRLDEQLEQVVDVATVFAAARHLSRRERLVLYLRFGEDLPQTEIARRLGLSQMHISRIIRSALGRLREIADDSAAATAHGA